MIAITIVCLPCICVIGTCVLVSHCYYSFSSYELPSTRRKRQREYEERERRRRTPRVLAPRVGEVDALTLGNEGVSIPGLGSKIRRRDEEDIEMDIDMAKAKGAKRTELQDQSPLFALPLEIRRQIYEDAIGGYILHIFTLDAYRRVSHARCKTASPSPASCSCTLMSRQPGVADDWGNTNLLSLVMSCRRM